MADPLPPPFWASADAWAKCPWCGSHEIENASVTLEQLSHAHYDRNLNECRLDAVGRFQGDAVEVDCPDCKRPILVTLKIKADGSRKMLLTPCRTLTDAKYLGAPPW